MYRSNFLQNPYFKSIQNDRHRTQKMEKVGVDRDLAVSHEGDEMRKRVESMQKYIEVLEENLELRISKETKNQTLEPPDLIQINAILAHDLKKLQEDVKKDKRRNWKINSWKTMA